MTSSGRRRTRTLLPSASSRVGPPLAARSLQTTSVAPPWLGAASSLASSRVAGAGPIMPRLSRQRPRPAFGKRAAARLASDHTAPIYVLDAPDLKALPFTFEGAAQCSCARTPAVGRKPRGPAPSRRPSGTTAEHARPSLFVDLARQAAEAGLAVTRSATCRPEHEIRPAEAAEVPCRDEERPCFAIASPRDIFPDGELSRLRLLMELASPPITGRRAAAMTKIHRRPDLRCGNAALMALFAQAETANKRPLVQRQDSGRAIRPTAALRKPAPPAGRRSP